MAKKTFVFFFAILFSISLFAAQETARMGVVTKSVENLHRAASDETDVVSQAIIGTNVKILKSGKNAKGEEWFQIETPDTYQGWMISTSLRIYKEGEKLYASEENVFEVQSLIAFIYKEDDVTEHKPLTMAPISALLEVGSCGERWCDVTLPAGDKGWIQVGDGVVRDAQMKRKRLSPPETVAIAKRFLGLPYLWGGNTPLGIDCSGFVQLIYRLSGIEILRDADIQMLKSGLVEVPPGEEKMGDLVFFGKSREKISHVGMMLNEKEFINATTHLRPIVQISELSEPYWKNIYQGARRPKE
jgi:cell wall-associated NlpC family hydrolase